MFYDEKNLRDTAASYGQDHLFRFWEMLNEAGRQELLSNLAQVDFPLMQRLIETWVENEPSLERFKQIDPVPVINLDAPDGDAAWQAGEEALRAGKVGIFLVAGGQGTRLGYAGPKGTYPVAPITGRSFFQYHADKIYRLQECYQCVLPWYIMVSETNEEATKQYFEENNYFDLSPDNIIFLKQRMMPCVDTNGKFLLQSPSALAMNPNGHGGCIPAMVENGVLDDARKRGVEYLSYFQVDNWAIKVADPRLIGYHVLHQAQMSSKNHRKNTPREAVGVHCICDGEYRVIEYSELDIYPQLLETDAAGQVKYYAGNPAIHVISVDFVQDIYDHFDKFPWHRAFKKIPYVNEAGELIRPETPNGYKFETFVFDALRFIQHEPVAVEIERDGEYTPTKQFEGDNSVMAARKSMNRFWAKWLEKSGVAVPRDEAGECMVNLEISPRFALTEGEFLAKSQTKNWKVDGDFALDNTGNIIIAS